jgi:hypothetical protein
MKNIDYTQIDSLCIPFIQFFNEIGLTTKYSCQGHDNKLSNKFYIMFDDNVDDKKIERLIINCSNLHNHFSFRGQFVKWARKLNGKIQYNWMYETNVGDYQLNQTLAHTDLKLMQSIYKKHV